MCTHTTFTCQEEEEEGEEEKEPEPGHLGPRPAVRCPHPASLASGYCWQPGAVYDSWTELYVDPALATLPLCGLKKVM